MSIDQALSIVRGVLSAEHEAGRVNSLEDLASRKIRRTTITTLWAQVQQELKQVQAEMNSLSALPPDDQIQWAQTVAAMPNLRFLEIDTTGLDREDEICRFTLVDQSGQVVEDFYIQPTSRKLSAEASRVNGMLPADLEQAPTITEVWERIGRALRGTYVLSYNQEWDLQRFKDAAARHNLPPITVIGECLQRHCTQYYHKEYYLTLTGLCERIGHPLPEPPNQTSIDRAIGQYHLLHAIALAVTDVRPPSVRTSQTASEHGALFLGESSLDDDLSSLDEHPF